LRPEKLPRLGIAPKFPDVGSGQFGGRPVFKCVSARIAFRAPRKSCLPGRVHFGLPGQDGNFCNVNRAPNALRAARRKPNLVTDVIDLFLNAIYPAKTKRLID
jgi:hypothetical protein